MVSFLPEPSLRYQPLANPSTHIRLLDLSPGSGFSFLKCGFRVVNVHDCAGSYEPLSYCWGKQRRLLRVFMNDGQSVRIGGNLFDALEHLRLPQEVRTLWVDALCINQSDTDEKRAQIPLMRTIYQNGKQTLAWLGAKSPGTPLAFQIIDYLCQYGEEHPERKISPQRWDEHRRSKALLDDTKPSSPLQFMNNVRERHSEAALDDLFGRPWFRRVWIIQEVAVSKNLIICCGEDTTTWDKIQKAYAASSEEFDKDGALENLILQRESFQSDEPKDFAAIACIASAAAATDPRDKIYGLLGLVDDDLRSKLVDVDYTISASEVYRRFTKNYLTLQKDLGILSHSIGCQDQKDEPPMPSWTFRLTVTPADVPNTQLLGWRPLPTFSGRDARFCCSRSSLCSPEFNGDGRLLGLSGYTIDIVEMIAEVLEPPKSEWESGIDSLKVIEALTYLKWREVAGPDMESLYMGSSDSIGDALRYCICSPIRSVTDETRRVMKRWESFVMEHFAPYAKMSSTFHTLTRAGLMLKALQLNYSRAFKLSSFDMTDLPHAFMPCHNRRLVKTQLGYLGVGHRNVQVGDEIVLLAGATAPMIMRKTGARYRIVGDCYLHGVMDGELWDESKARVMWIE